MRGRLAGTRTALLFGAAMMAGAALVLAPGATGHGQAAKNGGSLPTWHSLYDWSHRDGYSGWHMSTSSPADYGLAPGLGGNDGLWLWAKGGQHVYTQSDYAEWTFTAPGTTRLLRAMLSFSYRNKLFSHHCIAVGLRTAQGVVITQQELCRSSHSPSSQDRADVQLADPASNPTSTVLYLRIRVNCGGAATCHKTIPQLDPLRTGDFVRFLKADLTLVDDDRPVVQPSGPLWDVRDHFIDGTQTYGVTVDSTDAGSGVVGSSLVQTSKAPFSVDFIGAKLARCDSDHNTPALDARICPPDFSWDASVSTPRYAEGPNAFTAGALDVAGNVGTQAWTIYIDRTSPDGVQASGSLYDLAGQTTDGSDEEDLTISAFDPGAATQSASGIARVWLEEVGGNEIVSSDNPDCTELICPDSYSADFSVDLSGFADGDHTFVVKASDLLGHITEGPSWTITIQSAGDQTASDEGDTPLATDGNTDQPGGGADGYDPNADTTQSCGAYADFGVADWCATGDDSVGGTTPPVAPAAAAAATTSYAGCGLNAVFWSIGGSTLLQNVIAKDEFNVGDGCGQYYFAVNPASDKTAATCLQSTRSGWTQDNMHAAPVFQWSAWMDYANQHGKDGWYDAGVAFRQEMVAAGCQDGDRWFVNELPSVWHSDNDPAKAAKVRAAVADALNGLYTGGGLGNIKGFTADVVFGQSQTDMTEYRPGLEKAYRAKLFWMAVGRDTLGFSKEAYPNCRFYCLPGKTAAQISDTALNNYTYHEAYLGAAAPAGPVYGTAKAALRTHHMPLLNGVFNYSGPPYETHVSPKQMARLVNQQVYAARRLAATQVGAAGRIGFAWKESGTNASEDDITEIAQNLALALKKAYGPGGTAGRACVTGTTAAGTPYWGCPPASRSDAAPNMAWNIFKVWDPTP